MIKTNSTFKFKLIDHNSNMCKCGELFPSDYSFNGYVHKLKSYFNGKENFCENVYMGKCAFLEFFIKFFEKEIGISNFNLSKFYSNQEQKLGISGTGYRNKDFVTVSFKFNGKEFLTNGNSQITEYFVQSTYRSEFKSETNNYIYNVFTDNNDFHPNTIENFIKGTLAEGKVKLYNLDYIKSLVDNNLSFWESYFETLEKAIEEQRVPNSIVLDDDQLQAVKDLSLRNSGRYRVLWPTGTGKTEIMMGHIVSVIKKSKKKKLKFLTVSPRLLLIDQFMEKFANKLKSEKITNFTIVNYSSGSCDEDELNVLNCGHENAVATMSTDELKKVLHNATGHCFVFTTYKSASRILEAKIPFDIMNCDEAHNIVKGRSIPKTREQIVSEEVKDFIKMQVFYTATQAFSSAPDEDNEEQEYDNSICMSNKNQFGEIISKRSPREKINQGKIVQPRICDLLVKTQNIRKYCKGGNSVEDFEKNHELNAFIVCDFYKEVCQLNKRYSFDYKYNAIKLLVTCRGMSSFDGILNSVVLTEFKRNNQEISVFGISSNHIYIHGKFYSYNDSNKRKLLEELGRMSFNQSYILFHIDIIGEGYDAPGINSILPLNSNFGEIKSSQTSGRGMRPHPLDRIRLFNGSLEPTGRYFKEHYKPYVYIGFVNYEGYVRPEKYKKVVQNIISDLGYYPSEICFQENNDGKVIMVNPERPNEQHKVPDDVRYEFMEVLTAFEEKEKAEAEEREVKKRKEKNKTFSHYVAIYNDIKKNPQKYSEVEKNEVIKKIKKGY